MWRNEDRDEPFEESTGFKYVLVCVEHSDFGNPAGFPGQRAARDIFSHPEKWCNLCAVGEPVPEQVITPEEAVEVLEEIDDTDWKGDDDRRRLTETALLKKGDIVKLKGQQGTFSVQYIDQFKDPRRSSEVTVIGGTSGHSMYRTVVIGDVKIVKQIRQSA